MWYKKEIDETVQTLKTNLEAGLTNDEAKKRLEQYGPNTFQESKRPTLLKLLWEQMNSLLIYILMGAALISLVVGEVSDAVIILMVILLNAVIGVIQESKAEKALEELKKMASPKAIVKRDGKFSEIASEQVVPGDIVIIDAGRYIPADLRLVETVNLKVEESSLTGESVSVEKDANWKADKEIPLGEQKNIAFMSTLSTYGRGTGVVVHTGMETELGKIARMLGKQEKEVTPLQKKLADLGKVLGIGAIIVSIVIFLIGYFQGRAPLEMFLIAVSLAVAAIPEGLPAIVTIVLAIGVQRMIKRHAVVRKLPAVETLGAVSVICSDKTGTLTQNKMTVTKIYVNNEQLPIKQLTFTDPTAKRLIENMILCNDAVANNEEQTGDPTEIALIEAAQTFGLNKNEMNQQYPRIFEIPFDSDRKMMTTVHQSGNENIVMVKGAIERILDRVSYIEQNNIKIRVTDEHKNEIMKQANKMSNNALRVLAYAYKYTDPTSTSSENLETDLIFLGLTGMIDPPREEVKASIAQCKSAGIQTIMITGDHHQTALAIAKELGIAEHEDETMTGTELNALSDEKLKEKVSHIHVFARVSPEHKVRIVKAFKENGKIVSMTGDGVNDAPSLKQADVGVAMGITGTDVAKGAADIILTDDNFSTITAAVEEGRNIYKNIKKSILFLLSCNLGEIFTLFFGILMGWPAPLTAVHILWVNLITDTLPAISLGVDPDDPDVMKDKPRNPEENIFSKGAGTFTILNGLLIGFLTLFAFIEGLKFYSNASSIFQIDFSNINKETLIYAQTMAFSTLSITQLFHSFNLRHEKKSIFSTGVFSNRLLVSAVIAGIGIQIAIVSIPLFNNWFHIQALDIKNWAFIFGLAIVPVIVNEIMKAFKRTIGS
ncbi:calcium-transporting P-type ATPase, PMR1-type [Bacillus aquiflavi]|uniref:P-type Ca(2+) transporter n=1 Tax=Bacillus aquiflavi TaxID=2672567 RepID=A0A6B3VVG8_9BACI|nr:calcium-transporting P-type ATPase, PMR1-type [Bacillus aquiflavi]MBA4538004.1 calcium-transporting P-type ATPase, PMR1-type [Bacillus aquiflavi]NEY82260.1 calcium-transporting P-type ATPase, PMR1-type [Bacillus aquiflavi]